MEKIEISSKDFLQGASSYNVTDISSRIHLTEMCHTVMCHTVNIDVNSPSPGNRFFHFKTGKDQEWYVHFYITKQDYRSSYNASFALCLTNFPKYSPVKTFTSLYGLRHGSMFADFMPLDIRSCKFNDLSSLPNSLKIEINVLEKVECNIDKELNKSAIGGNDSPDPAVILFNEDQDIVLFSSEWQYGCHKEVLTNSSPVFKAMFDHDSAENKSGRVEIRDMEGPVVRSMLVYMYTGQCVGLEKYADKLVYAANKYELKTLETVCINYMVQSIEPDNAADMIIIADLYNNELLRDTAMRFVHLNFDKVVLTDGWKKLEQSNKSLCKLFKMCLSPSDDKQKSTDEEDP